MAADKIGLCVCYDTKNYGSQLQVLATQKAVEELGYDYEIIRYKKKLSFTFLIQTLPRFFNPYFVSGKKKGYMKRKAIAKYPQIKAKVDIRNKRFGDFVKKYFTKLSKPYEGYNALKEGSKNYLAVLTGSDQLWLPNNLGSHFFTQEFVADSVGKIAYATSFGVSQIPWYQKIRTAKYLKRFDFLSSRELNGSLIIKELTGIEALTVCDPTLLFSGEKWRELIPERKVVDKPYIFCYFLGVNQTHREEAIKLSNEKNLPIVSVPFLDNFVESDRDFGDIQMFDMDAADFVNLIRNAEYICTDSFHGTVFSILNHKKFVTFSRFSDENKQSRNSRIVSLFSQLGLEERHCIGDVLSVIDNEIDYISVEEKISEIRNKSMEYLTQSLSNGVKKI